MKKLFWIAAAVACAGALAALGGATRATASSEVSVHITPCFFGGGTATVPAGSSVTVFIDWIEQTRGRIQSYLESQTTTASVNNVPVPQASSLWSAPGFDSSFADYPWFSVWTYGVGTLAHAGDQVTITMQINLQHHIPAGKDPDTGKMFFDGPGDVFPPATTCTITAV